MSTDLLADLEELDDLENVYSDDEDNEDEKMEEIDEQEVNFKGVSDIKRLINSSMYKDTIKRVEGTTLHKDDKNVYEIILSAINLSVEIENEISRLHKFIRDIYAKKFPELEGLVLNPLDYIKAVNAIRNETNIAKVDLSNILLPSNVMVIIVTATTTTGKPLSDEDLLNLVAACETALKMDDKNIMLLEFVESKMQFLAPNLSILVGTKIGAKMMGAAGGLLNLSKMPACNIQLLGSTKKILAGFSTANVQRHVGFLGQTDLVTRSHPSVRRKAQRLLSAKCALAARVDAFKEAIDGAVGKSFLEDVEKKIEKFLEPPPLKNIKPLPVPLEGRKQKRAGKRVRKMKALYEQTEMRKLQNRVAFGQQEEEAIVGDKIKGLGMLTANNIGKIRGPAVDNRLKNQIKKVKTIKATAQRPATSGFQTTLSFTPVQGFELYNPEMAQMEAKQNQAVGKYFGTNSMANK